MDLTLIAFISLTSWIYLTFFRGGFWRADRRLGDAPAPAAWPEIAAIIPARDEAESIGPVISAHMMADYPGSFSIYLVDDQSSDGTAAIARNIAETKNPGNRPLHIVEGAALAPGWSGKLWAVQQGLIAQEKTSFTAKYILLTDADIVLQPQTLRRLVQKAEYENLTLASLMAKLDSRGNWGKLLIPAFIYFFQMLYPFPRANDANDNVAAAAGGCMLVRKDALKSVGAVGAIKSAIIDDCALARRIKDQNPITKIWLGLADGEATSLRDHRSLSPIWNMIARTAYAQLNYSPLFLAGALIGMTLVYLAAPLIVLTIGSHGNSDAFVLAAIAWGLMAYTYWPTLKLYDRLPWETALLPITAALYTAMTLSSALRHWAGSGSQWKGRTY